MQPGLGSEQHRDVVVGPSRVVAARAFGAAFDHAHVTSYDDFRTEVDLATLGTVGVVAAAETPDVLVDLVESLAASPGLRPSTLTRTGGTIAVVLRPAADVADADAEPILADLLALRTSPDATRQGMLGRLVSRLRT